MWIMAVVAYQIAVFALGVHQIRAQVRYARAHFDLAHCSRAGDSPDGLTRYCLPKDGCWLLNDHGAAACWRVASLVAPEVIR